MSKKIKHISFDVWKTLINPNKEYGAKRNEIIARHLDISIEEAKALYKSCKKFLDKSAEINGTCFNTPNCWKLLVKISGKKVDHIPMMEESALLFKDYLPHVNPELKDELKKLKDAGYPLSITSNTNFISGQVLFDTIFKDWDVFSSAQFSDLYEVAKPSRAFFNATFQKAAAINPDIEREEILHVGDNLICDAECVDSGFEFGYVKDPDDLLEKLKKGELVNA